MIIVRNARLLLYLFALLPMLAWPERVCAVEYVPEDPKTPLFVIWEVQFDPPQKGDDPHRHRSHAIKPLLTVYKLDDLILDEDKKAVRVVLTDDDAKIFAELTHKYEYLALIASKSAASLMHISGPIEDGKIPFNETNFALPVAQYIRERFGVKPNTNEMKPVKR